MGEPIVISYWILHFNNELELQDAVESALVVGWVLQGGVSVTNNPWGSLTFAQALIRNTPAPLSDDMRRLMHG